MADKEDEFEREWKNALEDLILLSLANAPSNDKTKELLETVCQAIIQNEELILHSSDDNENFSYFLIAVAAHIIGKLITTCQRFPSLALKASAVILPFCVDKIINGREKIGFSKNMLVNLIEGLCKGHGSLDREELTTLLDKIESLKVPETLLKINFTKSVQDASHQHMMAIFSQRDETQILSAKERFRDELMMKSTEWKTSFSNHCVSTLRNIQAGKNLLEFALNMPSLVCVSDYYQELIDGSNASIHSLSILRIEELSDELKIINKIMAIPILEPLNSVQLDRLLSITMKSLHAALFVASGNYDVIGEEKTEKFTSEMEDNCRKFSWRATEISLSILDGITSIAMSSPRCGGYVAQNLQTLGLECILKGLNMALENVEDTDIKKKDKVGIEKKSKWFSGMNIMLVSMASRCVILLTTLTEDLELEGLPNADDDEFQPIKGELHISIHCSSWQRLHYLMNSTQLPSQIWNMFTAAFLKAVSILENKSTPETEKTDDEEESKSDKTEKSKSSSEGDSSEEEGSLFGQWFENTLLTSANPATSESLKKLKTERGKTEEAYTQSYDIFLLLANSLLDLQTKFLPKCMTYKFEKIIEENFDKDFVSSLSIIIMKIDEISNEVGSKEDLSFYLHNFLLVLLTSDILDQEKMEYLLDVLGLSVSADKDWPLFVSPLVLSLFGRIALFEQMESFKTGSGHFDTPRAITAWKKLFQRLVEKGLDTNEHEGLDLNVEHLQLLMVLFHNFSEDCKEEILKLCIQSIERLANEDEKCKLNLPLFSCRLLVILDYLVHCYTTPNQQVIEQIQKNVLNDSSKHGEAKQSDYNCWFQEEDTFHHVISKLNSSPSQAFHFQKPRFYQLRPGDLAKLDVDSKVLKILKYGDATDSYYEEFYKTLLNLSTKMLLCFDIHQPDNTFGVLQVTSARSSFLQLWRLLSCLPLPWGTLLHDMADPKKMFISLQSTLFFLKWIPFVTDECTKTAEEIVKDLPDIEDLATKEREEFLSKLIQQYTDIPFILNIFECAIENFSGDTLETENSQLVHILLFDGLLTLLVSLFCKHCDSDEAKSTFKEDNTKNLLLILTNAIDTCNRKLKMCILKNQKTGLTNEMIEVYSRVGAIDINHLSKQGHLRLVAGLPKEIQQSLDTWQNVLLTQFPILPLTFSEKSKELKSDTPLEISPFIDTLLAAHVTVASTRTPFTEPAACLKHLMKTLIEILYCVGKWYKAESKDGIDSIKDNLMLPVVNMMIDSATEHIIDQTSAIFKLFIGSLDGEVFQQMLQSHVLSICDYLLMEEQNRPTGFFLIEVALLEMLKYIELQLEKTVTTNGVLQYFGRCPDHLSSILSSILMPKFSFLYVSSVLATFSRILLVAHKSQQKEIVMSIVSVFNSNQATLERWLLRILSKAEPRKREDGSSRTEELSALQILVDHAIRSQSIDLEILLSSCLNVLDEKITNHAERSETDSDTTETSDSSCLGEFVNVIITIAAALGQNGHQRLLKAVLNWISKSKDEISHKLKSSKDSCSDVCLPSALSAMLNYLLQVLLSLKRLLPRELHVVVQQSLSESDQLPLAVQRSLSEGDQLPKDETDCEVIDDEVGEDDESADEEESDDDTLNSKLCTFTVTQRDFMNQHWYHCHTCKMNDGVGCCTICAKVCHKDHDVTYAKYGSFFCDCGAKDDSSCKAMSKRNASHAANIIPKPISPFIAWAEEQTSVLNKAEKHLPSTTAATKKQERSESSLDNKHGAESLGSGIDIESRCSVRLDDVLQGIKDDVLNLIEDGHYLDTLIFLLEEFQHYHASTSDQQSLGKQCGKTLQEIMVRLHSEDKKILNNDQLMIPILGSQEGAFESVRLNFSGEQGQTVKQLLNAHVLRHTAMCLLTSPRGRRQHLAVTHEKGKITILQLSGLLKQPDTAGKKLTLNRLSSTTLPFTALSVSSNPANEDVVSVCGLKDCHVISFSHSGTVANHLALPLQMETGNFIVKTIWLTGCPTKLALLTSDFVKIYDLSQHITSQGNPEYHFVLPSGKVRDVSFIQNENGYHLIMMSSHGHIYTQVLDDTSKASGGPFYLTNVMSVDHSTLKDNDGQIGGGGVSVYYSHVLHLLFISYSQGTTLMVVPKLDLSGHEKIFHLSSQSTNSSALCQWTEVHGQPGLLHCVNQLTGYPVVLMVKPEEVMIQEIKSSPGKSKIQDAVCYYHSFPVTINSETVTEARTSMIVLLEDGSLRIYNAGKVQTNFWLHPQFRPKSLAKPSHPRKTRKQTRPTTSQTIGNLSSFSIDFFESCQQSNDVEFGGPDVLHVYNSQQVKHRLNTAGMYIASTKPSGFKIEITNTSSSTVMMGVRAHIGVRSMENVPTCIEVFGRSVSTKLLRNRWFDFPFTRNESLTADKKVTVRFGPSSDPSGVSMIDSIKVYTKTKEAFGWPDDASEQAHGRTESLSEQSGVSIVPEKSGSKVCSKTVSAIGKVLDSLNAYIACFPVQEGTEIHEKLLAAASAITNKGEPHLQSQAKALLAALFASKSDFHTKKDQMQLSGAVERFRDSVVKDEKSVDLESFHGLIQSARSVGGVRPRNLVKFIGDSAGTRDFTDEILDAFWKLHSYKPSNYFLAPISAQAVGSLVVTVEAMVEVLFAMMVGGSEDVIKITENIIVLLLNKDESVSFAAKRGLSQALLSRRKVTVVIEATPPQCSSPAGEAEDKDEKDEEPIQETQPSEVVSHPVSNNAYAQDMLDSDLVSIEDLEQGAGDIQELLLNDDETAMEIAIALSLQEHDPAGELEDDEFNEELEEEIIESEPQADQLEMPEGYSVTGSPDEFAESAEPSDAVVSNSPVEQQQQINDISQRKELHDERTNALLESCLGQMLEIFIDHLGDLKKVTGMQAIPYLQVLLLLCSNLKETDGDQANVQRVVLACLKQLDLDNKDSKDMADRTSRREVQLVIMRFLSVLMSPFKTSKSSSKDGNKTTDEQDVLSSGKWVAKMLAERGVVDYCLLLLKSLLPYWRTLKTSSDDENEDANVLLKPTPSRSPPDMSPFFLKQYVKSHSNDLFEAFPQLVTEMVLRLPYQIRKLFCESEKNELKFDDDWTYYLCEYMMASETPFVRRQVRKLLLALCGSKEKYRYIKDIHILRSHINAIRVVVGTDILKDRQKNLLYDETVELTEHAKSCVEIAMARNVNWQTFCKDEKDVLPFLLQVSYLLSEHVSGIILQLIGLALVGPGKQSSSAQAEGKQEKTPKEGAVYDLMNSLFDESCSSILFSFIKFFLLESNSTNMRWKAHDLLHTIFRNVDQDHQFGLLRIMWQLWDHFPSAGHKAAQFIDILGYFTIKAPTTQQKLETLTSSAMSLLSSANNLLLHHPNASVYRRLQRLVEVDGFFLESDPCLVCNNPEVPFTSVKLASIKSDMRYTTTAQLVKLNVNYTISRLLLRISDIKRSKMVKTINIYYNNKPVPSVVELKNKPNIWQKAKRVNLTPGQTDIKIDFTLPIVAYNLMIEYADFYDNLQLSAETLQCPRCSASVPANPGVCANCGENVYQCHKCRAINYDERDPFLCTSCGFCKYAKFEYTLVTKPCYAVEPVQDESERQKALNSVISLLEQADKIYQQLTNQKQALEMLLRTDDSTFSSRSSSASIPGSAATSPTGGGGMSPVNKSIQSLAQKYCTECKASFEDLSKIIQKVTVTRKELSNYDQRQQDSVYLAVAASPGAFPSSPGTSMPTFPPCFITPSDIAWTHEHAGMSVKERPLVLVKCYGCALSTVEHCLTILKAFATVKGTHEVMLKQGLLNQLLDHNLQQRNPQVISLARTLIIMLTKDNSNATDELNRIISKQIQVCLESKAANVTSVISLSNQMSVLGQSLNSYDSCWEQRLKCIFKLFLDSVQRANVDVMDTVTLPCLKILSRSMKQVVVVSEDKALQEMANLPLVSTVKASNWLNGPSDHSYANWCSKAGSSSREIHLTRKYVSIWKERLKEKKTEIKEQGDVKKTEIQELGIENDIDGDTWLRLLLFTPSSKAVRQTTCSILENLCQTPTKKEKLLHLFSRYLEDLHTAGENAADFLGLYKVLLKSPEWKIYFASYGILDKLFNLIIQEVDFLSMLETTTFTFDLSQGYPLHSLTEILKIFFEDDKVKSIYKSRFVGNVLHCYLSLRRLVVQRTKLIDTTEDILLSLLEQLTSGTEAEERSFMAICVDALRRCAIGDIRTPVFIYERLCNIIHKEEKEVKEFFIIIEKDPQQEDFLQGRMQGNPYSSKEVGLGPLMRDIKNKICTECELIALLDDDTGMELLVNNKIISLDLPVADVFKKIWCVKGERQDPMKIVYRMRGLLGDATEDMINSLDTDKDKDVDEEHEYRLASVIAEVGGLDVILKRLSCVRDLSRTEQLVSVILKLLEYCVKVKVNRQYLSKPSSNALNVALATLNLALRLERDLGSKSGGAMIAERLLNIMGIILHEASATHTEHYKLSELPGEESQLELLLGHITSPYVRSNPSVLQAMMRLIPFLSFGIEQSMKTLIEHFMPYLDFERFDDERSSDETLYLDCFCVIAAGISKTGIGSRLKDLINDSNITSRALEYLRKHTPPKTFSASGILDTTKWKEFLARPSLPYVLRLLTGLTAGHAGTQMLVGSEENVAVLHRLEQVSSEEMVGSLAENLMEELREHTDTKTKVMAVRRETRNEKKKMALAMRQKQLEALGMEVTVAGQIKAKPTAVIKEMEELLEEKGLVCCICREGYKFHPTKVLGIYTYTTRCVLDEFENRPRKTQGYTTVSTFNVIHFDCHSEAIRHARCRDEWESAGLQNANTKCNGLMPIWGPKVSESAFATCLARHNNYLQECTGFREPTFHSTVHDLRLVLQRFAHEKSFNDESGGGGRISNIYLIPYMAHIALYVLNTTRLHSTEEKVLASFLASPKTKWIEAAYETDGTLFMTVLSIFILPLKQWKEKRVTVLQQLIVLAHARKLSATGLKKLVDVEPKEYKEYKPALLFFALVDNFHEIFKGKLGSNEEDWGQVMSTYMRNNDEALLKGCDKLLSLYENELLPCASFAEFCDVTGLLEYIQDPVQFLKNTLDTTNTDE